MAIELIKITTEDGHRLDSLVHNAERLNDLDTAVLYLHGKGGAFYTGPGRYIPESPPWAASPASTSPSTCACTVSASRATPRVSLG